MHSVISCHFIYMFNSSNFVVLGFELATLWSLALNHWTITALSYKQYTRRTIPGGSLWSWLERTTRAWVWPCRSFIPIVPSLDHFEKLLIRNIPQEFWKWSSNYNTAPIFLATYINFKAKMFTAVAVYHTPPTNRSCDGDNHCYSL